MRIFRGRMRARLARVALARKAMPVVYRSHARYERAAAADCRSQAAALALAEPVSCQLFLARNPWLGRESPEPGETRHSSKQNSRRRYFRSLASGSQSNGIKNRKHPQTFRTADFSLSKRISSPSGRIARHTHASPSTLLRDFAQCTGGYPAEVRARRA